MIRSKAPEATLKILDKYISKALITRISDLSGMDDVCTKLCVFSAIRPAAKSLSVSMGKSKNKLLAKCGAVVESLETYFAEEVKPELRNISESDISKNKKILKLSNLNIGRCSFLDTYPLNWNRVNELKSDNEAYVPSYLISLDSTILENQFFGANSSGLASGNTIQEALIMSLLEQVERTSVRNEAIPVNNKFEHLVKGYGIKKDYILNTFIYENPYYIPVVGVHIYNDNQYSNQCVYKGYGASNTYQNAFCRALEEAIQSKVGVISGARDDLSEDYYRTQNRKKKEDIVSENIYPGKEIDVGSDNNLLLIALMDRIYNVGHKVFRYDYLKKEFFIVKTIITNSEDNIL